MSERPPGKAKYVGKVRLIERIGHGSMGVVYRGYHDDLQREVAIKILSNKHDDTQRRLLRRFKREGKAAATVQHPNVVRVFESGDYHGRPYIVMELVIGASLGDVLDQKRLLAWDHALSIAVAIAEGLAAIHSASIIHRDIKPDNILLGEDGSVKITDLGLARYLDDQDLSRLTATGVVVGTPLYVAPEAIKDTLTSGPAADVYSLGATVYHAIAGEPPFNGESPYELMRHHLQREAPPLADLAPNTPPFVCDAIMACLAKDPAARPTASQLADLLRGRPVSSRTHLSRRLVLTTIAIVAVLATGTWMLLNHLGGGSALLSLDGITHDTRWRLDDGPWQTGGVEARPTATGQRCLQVRRYQPDGRLLTGEIRVVLTRNVHCRIDPRPAMAMTTVDRALTEVPGEGMIYCQGRPVGFSPPIPFAAAGRYHVCRWDGKQAQGTVVEVAADGLAIAGWQVSAQPDPRAYFVDPGGTIDRYHLVTVAEIRFAGAVTNRPVPMPPADADPCRAATDLPPETVSCWEDWRSHQGVRLPRQDEAVRLAALLRVPVWFRSATGLQTTTSGSGSLLVAMPQETAR
jgi:serine/threonine-protein kinase